MQTALVILTSLFLASAVHAGNLPPIQTVFVILLENENWADIKDNPSAPYLNHMLLPMAARCEQYYNPPDLHPSLPNYLWLEAGTNFGIFDDNDPVDDHLATTNHFTSLLKRAGISWRAYQEDIAPGYVPLENTNNYAVRHNPFAYFDDVTGINNPNYAYGIAHIRPYDELAGDLTNNTVARYNFVTPNVINDGHDTVPPDFDQSKQIDDWLAAQIPKILHSPAYSNNGAIFITWDEGEPDGPIGMIVLSPLARGGGYFNNIHYTHSSALRTFQEIFGITPLLGDAAKATDLSDLFTKFSIATTAMPTNGVIRLVISGVVPGRTNFIQASTNLLTWQTIHTNWIPNDSPSNSFSVIDNTVTNFSRRFYRVLEAQ